MRGKMTQEWLVVCKNPYCCGHLRISGTLEDTATEFIRQGWKPLPTGWTCPKCCEKEDLPKEQHINIFEGPKSIKKELKIFPERRHTIERNGQRSWIHQSTTT